MIGLAARTPIVRERLRGTSARAFATSSTWTITAASVSAVAGALLVTTGATAANAIWPTGENRRYCRREAA